MPLPITVQFHHNEVALDLPSRLAHANGYSSVRRFLLSARIKPSGVMNGQEEALKRLVRWSGVEVDQLARFASKSDRSRRWKLGEATFDKEARPGNRYRFCPSCVAEDMSSGEGRPAVRTYTRAAWMTRAIQTCAIHRRPIVEVKYAKAAERDFIRYVAENAELIRADAAQIVPAQKCSVDYYVHDRIFGAMSEPYLDQFEVHVALNLCRHFGGFLKRHPSALKCFADDLRTASNVEIGFHVARQGEDKIREAVAFISATTALTAKSLYGSLGRWLRENVGDEGVASLIELFQDLAERNLPFAAGELCIIPVRRRHIHTIRSAANEYQMSTGRVLQLAQENGLVLNPGASEKRILLDAEGTERVLDAAATTLTSKEARSLLGLNERIMSLILRAGFINVVERKANGRDFARIRQQDLKNFQVNLFSQAAELDEENEFLVPIAKACQKSSCLYEDVVRLILNRSLSSVSVADHHNMALTDLRVDWREVVSKIVPQRKAKREEASAARPSGLLNCRQAERHLRVTNETLRHLIESGYLKTETARNIRTNFNQDFITLSSVEAFKDAYISIADLGLQWGTHPIKVATMLTKMGVSPIYKRVGRVGRFYRRSELRELQILKS